MLITKDRLRGLCKWWIIDRPSDSVVKRRRVIWWPLMINGLVINPTKQVLYQHNVCASQQKLSNTFPCRFINTHRSYGGAVVANIRPLTHNSLTDSTVYLCISLYIAVNHCIYSCISLYITVYRCISLYITEVYRFISLNISVYRCKSLYIAVYHCKSLSIAV